jgi:hypothetical protein
VICSMIITYLDESQLRPEGAADNSQGQAQRRHWLPYNVICAP